LFVLDAFSSDAIPLHLLTREAIQLYLDKLAEGGILAFHISNRYLDLKPVLANLARDAKLACWAKDDLQPTEREKKAGKDASQWVVMAREKRDLDKIIDSYGWHQPEERREVGVWTDDFSNILSVFKWE